MHTRPPVESLGSWFSPGKEFVCDSVPSLMNCSPTRGSLRSDITNCRASATTVPARRSNHSPDEQHAFSVERLHRRHDAHNFRRRQLACHPVEHRLNRVLNIIVKPDGSPTDSLEGKDGMFDPARQRFSLRRETPEPRGGNADPGAVFPCPVDTTHRCESFQANSARRRACPNSIFVVRSPACWITLNRHASRRAGPAFVIASPLKNSGLERRPGSVTDVAGISQAKGWRRPADLNRGWRSCRQGLDVCLANSSCFLVGTAPPFSPVFRRGSRILPSSEGAVSCR